ncbi:hypothetical protein [Bosea vestrisii]|uniref:Uncharacterized protein n=1 Tax=Bosea vestrisii TaxID=151416 RepID=A0ABW0H810_9HYPH
MSETTPMSDLSAEKVVAKLRAGALTAKEQLLSRLERYSKSRNPMGYYGRDSFIDQGAVVAITNLLDALTAAAAEKERLRAVLRPFADAANGLAPDLPATDQVLLTVGGLPIAWVYTDQLRTARAALSEKEQGA